MKRKSIAIVAGLLMASSLDILAAGSGSNIKCQPFKMSEVRLLPSRFQENMKRDSAWMMSIPVGSLLQSFRNTSGTFASREGGCLSPVFYQRRQLLVLCGQWLRESCEVCLQHLFPF